MMQNNLFVKELLIYTEEGRIAYNEKFHKGVNIIRGDNSSGKSTITHFIFFVLGGAFGEFVPEARQCSVVQAEIEINGATITIKRELIKDEHGSINTKSPIYFFWGCLEESKNPPKDKFWTKFEYNTTQKKKSFSNVLFENLGFPLVKADNNLTMHQILRLLYIDQESPTSSLFMYEHFDSQITRETVSDLLLGVYNEELYENKKRLVVAEKEFSNIKSELKATEQFFKDPLTLNPSHVKSIIESKREGIKKIEDEIIEIKVNKKKAEFHKGDKLEFQELSRIAIKQRSKVLKTENRIDKISYEIEDSQYFINTLEDKIKALRNSIQTRDFLGGLQLDYCPECLTDIKPIDDPKLCKLCKETKDESHGVVKARRMEQEIGFQIKESKELLALDERKLLELQAKYNSNLVKLEQIQIRINSSVQDVKSYTEEVLDKLYGDRGFIEGEILQFSTMLENAELYEKLKKKKIDLDEEVKYLKGYIYNTEKKHLSLKESINKKVRQEGLYLLNNDLDRQDEFKNAKEFYIDYSNNLTFLSNKYSKYSASSNFYLKVTARFSIFLASLSIDSMRFPRFIFADNMEDKGIELKRAQNLQKTLINRLFDFNPESYQMIYTTSYITEELNKSDLVVGEYYTKENPSLKNILSQS